MKGQQTKFMMKTRKQFTLGLAVASLSAASAMAIPQLRISSGGSSITITDQVLTPAVPAGGVAGDGDSTPGTISGSFVNSLNGWTINSVTATLSPNVANGNSPAFTLDANAQWSGSGTAPQDLTFLFTDTGYTRRRNFTVSESSTHIPDGSASDIYIPYLDLGNVAFATTTAITTQKLLTSPGGFAPGSGSPNVTGPYSITLQMVFHGPDNTATDETLGQQGQAYLNAPLRPVRAPDGGNTLMLIGFSFAGLSMLSRFRSLKA